MEHWLSNNRRVMFLGMIPPMILAVVGVVLAAGVGSDYPVLRWLGVALTCFTATILGILFYLARLPRIGYGDGYLLLYLRSARPICVPIEIVECFFLGQGPTRLAKHAGSEVESTTVVVRLAEDATEWHQQEVKPSLGHWCDGYITIRGTWCEPLSVNRVNQLNRRLAEAKRQKGLR